MDYISCISPEDLEETVICDICNADYTDSPEEGGILVGSYALCPKCAKNHQGMPDDSARKGETFQNFVLRIRKSE